MIILGIDSATQSASCAILNDDVLLGEISFNYKKQHSVILMKMIDTLLKNTGLDINSIDGVVCSKGPGSFTGLRIGMATAKGLCQGTNKPLISVSSLDGLSNKLAYTDGIICPMLDALRDNVYSALYKFENNELKKISDYMVINIDELINILNSKDSQITFIGDAVFKFKDKLKSSIKNCSFAPSHLNISTASSLAEIGLKSLKLGECDNILNCSPIYLRKSQAEREYENKLQR